MNKNVGRNKNGIISMCFEFLLLAALVFALFGCGDGGSSSPTVTGVTVSPSSVTVLKGTTQQFTAAVAGKNGPSQKVRWDVTGNASNINSSGLLTVAADETAGTLTVTAFSAADSGKSGTAIVTVLSPNTPLSGTVSITGIAKVGIPLTANILNLAGTGNVSYQWKSSTTADSAVTTDISGAVNQTYTPSPSDAGKFLRVTVTRTGFIGSVTSASTTIVLSSDAPTPTVTSVSVSPKTADVARGAEQQFSAVVTGTNNPDTAVIWSLTGNISQNTTLTQAGLLTVAAGETSSALTVKAVSVADNTKSDTAAVTVPIPVITSVNITPPSPTVSKGGFMQFYVTIVGANNPSQSVTWTVTSEIAGTTITDGLLTVASGETAETLKVRATSTVDTSKFGEATVTIQSPPAPVVSSVIVNPLNPSVVKGATQQFSAIVNGSNNPAQSVTWTVTGGGAGTFISNSGVLTVAAAETATSLTIRAASTEDNTKSGVTTAYLIDAQNAPTVTSVTINPLNPPIIYIGSPIKFTAAVTGTNNPPLSVNWSLEGSAAGSVIGSDGTLTVAHNEETDKILTIKAVSTADSSKSSALTVTVKRSALTGSVLIIGAPQENSTLTANISNLWGAGPVSYQWKRAGEIISGAVSASYMPVTADIGKTLSVTVTRTGNTGSITSSETAAVTAAPANTGTVNGSVTINDGISDVTVSFEQSGIISLPKNGSITVTVDGSYQAYRWYVDGLELIGENGKSLYLDGSGYSAGVYRILLLAYKNSIPYSQEIRFSVN
ncbi:MAG: Ig-like domain-containing protein [Treponema sp.]|nr:Ig-like domain-containing protein [Treponema sp.]